VAIDPPSVYLPAGADLAATLPFPLGGRGKRWGEGERGKAMPYRYRLIDESGNDLGALASRRAEMMVGERVSRWHGEELEIVNFVPAHDEQGLHGYVVVKPR
jgi:hypothetical protein